MDKYFQIKDCNNNFVFIDTQLLLAELHVNGFKFFDIGIDGIFELRKQYLVRNGKLPMTVESIQKIFDYK